MREEDEDSLDESDEDVDDSIQRGTIEGIIQFKKKAATRVKKIITEKKGKNARKPLSFLTRLSATYFKLQAPGSTVSPSKRKKKVTNARMVTSMDDAYKKHPDSDPLSHISWQSHRDKKDKNKLDDSIKNEKPFGEDNMCLVCFDRPSNSVFLPCGHSGICDLCGMDIYKKTMKCHLCQSVRHFL